jgi:CRP/FNR family cyclic AMP-dependent transcriptional regulator
MNGSAPLGALTTLQILQRNYLFRGLPSPTLGELAALALRRRVTKDTVVFTQGGPGDALYGIASGRVRISASGPSGQEVYLNIMDPGDVFGEIAVMDGLPRTASATAIEATVLVVIQRSDFLALLQREPQLAIHLMQLLCARLRWTSELVEESAFLSGPSRLAKRLLILAALHGRPESGRLVLQISQSDLALFLGMSRQLVNQHLQDWRRQGWVDLARGRIGIADPHALGALI